MQLVKDTDLFSTSIKKQWETSLDSLKDTIYYSPLQTYAWMKFIKKVFPKSFILYDKEDGFFYIVQVLTGRLGTYGWIRHAPVNIKKFKLAPSNYLKGKLEQIYDVCNEDSMGECKVLSWVSVQFRAVCPGNQEQGFCRQPNINDIFTGFTSFLGLTENRSVYSVLHEYDFERTVIVDLTKPLKVSSTTRRYYNKAKKLGLELKESNNPEPLYDLLVKTAQRKGYSEWGRSYLINKYKILSEDRLARIFYVMFKKKIIYGAIYVGDKNYIVYDHGGGYGDYLYLNPAYFMHYSVLQLLQKQGYRFFDFGGVGTNNPKHPLYRNSQIKYRFGGDIVRFIHSWEVPLKKRYWLLYRLYTYARNSRLGWYN